MPENAYQSQEQVQLTDLTKSFESGEELKLAMQKMYLTERSAQLKTENELFNEHFLAHIDESANNKDEKFKALRADAIEEYAELLKPINSLIENYALMLKRPASATVEDETE